MRARGAAWRVPSSARPPRGAATRPLARARACLEGWQKGGRDRAWSARGRSRGASTRGHDRVGAPARARLQPGVQPARAAFLLRADSRCCGLGWVLRDAAGVVLRLARALNMHSQGGPALGVQGGWCRGRAARSGGGVPSSARPPRDAPNAPQGRAHARRWDPSGRGGEKGGRDRAWSARGCSEGTPTWGHGRVGAMANARLRPGVQLLCFVCARARAAVSAVGWGWRCATPRGPLIFAPWAHCVDAVSA